MSEERYKGMFEALLAQGQEDAVAIAIAKHLSLIALGVVVNRRGLYPEVNLKYKMLREYAAARNHPIRCTSGLRVFSRQDALYAQGRTTRGNIVTNAKAGQSYHNYGLAFDVAFTGDTPYPNDKAAWTPLGEYAESIGLTWGASFGDYGHFEYHNGFTWEDIINYFKL